MQGNKLINTHGRLIENIFKAHAELAELNRQTPKCKFHRDFGIEWELKDGVVLYPRNTITDYLSGLFAILWPEAPLIVVDNYPPHKNGNKFPKNCLMRLLSYAGCNHIWTMI